MRKNERLDQPAHQPLRSVLVIFWKSFGGLIRSLWPLLLYFFISNRQSNNYWLLFGTVGLATISFVVGILKYYHFLYHIENGKLIIASGLFTKTVRNIPLERIQSIRLEQKFIHRFLRLYSVKFDTAGTANEEIEIPALDKEGAEEIQKLIGSKANKKTFDPSIPVVEKVEEETLLFRLKLSDIFQLGITDNHIRNFFIIFGVLLGFSTQLGEVDSAWRIDRWIEYAIENRGELQVDASYLYVIPAIVAISVLVSLVMTLFRYYNLRVMKTRDGYRVAYGLINLAEHYSLIRKIQIFKWSISPLRKLLGLYHINIRQASSREIGRRHSINIPGARSGDVNRMIDRIFHRYAGSPLNVICIHKKFFIRFVFIYAIIPLLIGIMISWWLEYRLAWMLAALWSVIAMWMIYRYHNRWTLSIYPEFLQINSGIFSDRRERVFLFKLQGVMVRQTPFQVRHQLASLTLSTAAGNLQIPYITMEEATILSDLLLFKIESSKKSWM